MTQNTKPIEELSNSPPENRRISPRANCSIPAKIKHNGLHLCDCVIKDVSEVGMRLFAPAGHWLPKTFEIHASSLGGVLLVNQEWAASDHVGVSFKKDQS